MPRQMINYNSNKNTVKIRVRQVINLQKNVVNTNARTTTIIGNNIKQIFRNAPVSTYKTN